MLQSEMIQNLTTLLLLQAEHSNIQMASHYYEKIIWKLIPQKQNAVAVILVLF